MAGSGLGSPSGYTLGRTRRAGEKGSDFLAAHPGTTQQQYFVR